MNAPPHTIDAALAAMDRGPTDHPGAGAEPPPPPPIEREIAASLSSLSQEIEALGARICSDPEIGTRHLNSLQAIDRVGQYLRELSRVLAAPDRRTAIQTVALGELRERLIAAIAGGTDQAPATRPHADEPTP